MGINTTDHILRVAEQLIHREGVIGFKFCSVAKEAGISTTTLYKSFSNKEDLLVALASKCFDGSKSKKWWLTLDYDALSKVLAYYTLHLDCCSDSPFYSSMSTLACNQLICSRSNHPHISELNKHAYGFWQTPIELLQQARAAGQCQLTDDAIQRLCGLISVVIRGRELISNTEVGRSCSEDAALTTRWILEFCFKQMGFDHFELREALDNADTMIMFEKLKQF
ncbi:TetR/AcrR family transcriptional regulator [Shewanella submarina]|uniref:TetR/AcrR family transcriptional regulator n=1 Tax=Shewanella submarina TaxID=2016376 RepID=A0ABV7GA29_9GAMM|nr:TetR/AcrR family transcriptional regulator [Shewanella submarina]MCL1038377.1 TetR/AcrR family transcriptional regulator [Shewanella submarina]